MESQLVNAMSREKVLDNLLKPLKKDYDYILIDCMRDVPMSEIVKPIFEEALAEMKENKEGTIFYDYNMDRVVSTTQVCIFFRRICLKHNIPYYGQHALRHTFATRCIESGIQPNVLKTWLGHTNIHVTLDTYADVFNSMNNDAINMFERYMRNI